MAEEFNFGDDSEEVIGRGTWIDKIALNVIDMKVSESAQQKIEKAGGSVK